MSASNSKLAKNAAASSTASNSKQLKAEQVENTAGVHNIPIIKHKDNTKLLPTYSAALQRSADDYVAAEDLDNIQLELETLLSNVALRYRVLKQEYENMDKDEKKNERRTKGTAEKPPASPATATAAAPGKRKRDEAGLVRKPKHATTSTLKNTKYAKHSPISLNTDDSMDFTPQLGSSAHLNAHGHHGQNRDHHMPKMVLPKNDMPNKFWLSVEPYCMPLTNEDLRVLDNLLEQYSGPLVPPIPDLGPHYADTWAMEDIKDIQQASSANKGLKQQNNAANEMIKKADAMVEKAVTGPLTQRLVSALMEEQLVPNPAELVAAAGVAGESSNSSSENTHSNNALNFRSLSMLRNCVGIEKRIKKELIEQGLLDASDFPHADDDEVHTEIKRLIAELSAVAEFNSSSLKRLRAAATEEIKRLDIKRKLDAIDQEILETYKRTLQNKARRKPMTPEEQQEIYRLTAEQKNLSDQLERQRNNCFLYEFN